jgi:hypothetical protein
MWNTLFIILIAAAVLYIYVDLIRPKLRAIAAFDAHFGKADERYARWGAKLKGWRIEAGLFTGVALLELPNLIDAVAGANVVSFLPEKYQHIAQIVMVALAFIRAYITNKSAQKTLENETE